MANQEMAQSLGFKVQLQKTKVAKLSEFWDMNIFIRVSKQPHVLNSVQGGGGSKSQFLAI